MAIRQQQQALAEERKRAASKASLDSVEQRRLSNGDEIGTLEPPLPEIKDTNRLEASERQKGLARLTKSLLEQHEAFQEIDPDDEDQQ